LAVTAVVSATVVVTALVAAALTGSLDLRDPVTESAEPPCASADTSMNETLSRMFALMATDADQLASCWTDGKADPDALRRYLATGAPSTYVLDNEHSRGRDGVLYAAVLASARWAGPPPIDWERGSATKVIVLRQQRDWSWTIDTIQPRTREGMSDVHCGVCHR
jgi:hypothetical protein